MVSPPLLVRFPVFFNVAPEWSLPKYARSEAKAHGLGGKQTPRNVFNEGVVSPVAHTDKNKGYPHYPCEDGCGSTSRTKETSGAQQVPVGSRLTPLTLCAHRGEHQVPDSSTPTVCLTGVHGANAHCSHLRSISHTGHVRCRIRTFRPTNTKPSRMQTGLQPAPYLGFRGASDSQRMVAAGLACPYGGLEGMHSCPHPQRRRGVGGGFIWKKVTIREEKKRENSTVNLALMLRFGCRASRNCSLQPATYLKQSASIVFCVCLSSSNGKETASQLAAWAPVRIRKS